jgi:hypothetical protein
MAWIASGGAYTILEVKPGRPAKMLAMRSASGPNTSSSGARSWVGVVGTDIGVHAIRVIADIFGRLYPMRACRSRPKCAIAAMLKNYVF